MPFSLSYLRRLPPRLAAPAVSTISTALAGYLALQGRPWMSLIAGLITCTALIASWWLYRAPSRNKFTDLLIPLCISALAALIVGSFGNAALPWNHLALMLNFLLAPRRTALKANVLLVLALLAIPGGFLGPSGNLTALLVSVLMISIGYACASHAQTERSRLKALATRDALTGLPNRHALDRALSRLTGPGQDTSRYQHAVLMLDLDHFKQVNDRFGHHAGDQALVELSVILRSELRELDQVFRYGGEEFVILAKIQSRQQLEALAQRICAAVNTHLRSPAGQLSISIGGAIHAGETHWPAWLSRADSALYQAKRQGRNRYVIADTALNAS